MKENGKLEILEAEKAVSKSLSTFESALDGLAHSIDEIGLVVQNVVAVARLPKEQLRIFNERLRRTWAHVRRNPQPYILGAVSALAIVSIAKWLSGIRLQHAREFYQNPDLPSPVIASDDLHY